MAHGEKRYDTVAQVMTTDVFTVSEDELVDLVVSMMDWKNIRFIPVENNAHELVGMVTYKTLLNYYLSYFDASKYFSSELSYYRSQSAFLQEDYEKARFLVRRAIKENQYNIEALLFSYELYGLGYYDKEHAVYNIIEAR